MPRRTPTPLPVPRFQVTILEQVEVEGQRFTRQDILFEADVPASYQRETRYGGPTRTTITCTLSESQGQAYWHALGPRYTAGEECAWFFHFGPGHGTMCIGYLTEWRVWKGADDRLTYTLLFHDSGSKEFPVRHRVSTPPAN